MIFFFYLFAILALVGSAGVITSRNPVHAVLWLIFVFCNTSGLFILLGAEFLAFILIIVYAGAVAILFLFVIMMIEIKFSNFTVVNKYIAFNTPVALIIAFILISDLSIVIFVSFQNYKSTFVNNSISNVNLLGRVLYTDYILPFQLAGVILFIAMVGCIVLTLRKRLGVKRQNHLTQIERSRDTSIKIVKVK